MFLNFWKARGQASSFFIASGVLETLEGQARQGYPREVCGFLAGEVFGQAQLAYPAKNSAPLTEAEYLIRPEETLAALLELEGRGLKITGVYHSHPNYPARPSQLDLTLAGMPGAFYLITSVFKAAGGALDCKTTAWLIENKQAYQAEMRLTQ